MDGLKNLYSKYSISLQPLSSYLFEQSSRPHTVSEVSRPQKENKYKGRPLTSNNFIQ